MFVSTAAGFTRTLKKKGMFSGDSKKSKKSLLGAADGTPKKKVKYKKPATGYRPAPESTSLK